MGINEILLFISVLLTFGGVLVFYRLFGKGGLYAYTAVVTIAANIEVLMLVHAFGIDMTLGNILFASTFLITDVLSENEGRKAANKSVCIGIAVSVLFILISQLWLFYVPAEGDMVSPAICEVFSKTPRMMISGFLVYAIVQFLDVYVYHKIWDRCYRRTGDRKKLLWLRNMSATLLSQLLNSVLFNLFAFYGTYGKDTLISIIVSTFVIYAVAAVLDTPFIYAARRIRPSKE